MATVKIPKDQLQKVIKHKQMETTVVSEFQHNNCKVFNVSRYKKEFRVTI